MDYKYLKVSPSLSLTPKEIFVNDFQALLNEQFTIASDIWTVQEESIFASKTYSDVEVRIITHVINSATGKYLGDDYRQILFKDLDHAVGLGFMYQFDNNYWITINSEKTKNLAASSTIKRCNNTLRWIDLDGAVHSEPCSIDYTILQNRDYTGMAAVAVIPTGNIELICQYNDRTNLIRPNQRFLFGNVNNWTAYRIVGGGINNYQNTETLNNTTAGFIRLTMVVDYVSDNDDLVNGICYDDKNVYALTLGQTGITGLVGATGIQIYPTVTFNGETVTRDVLWTSSNTGMAIIGPTGIASGQTGIPSILALGGTTGTAVITCALDGNTGIHAHVNVDVVYGITGASDQYQVIIDPNKNYILEGDTQAYGVYLYKNGIQLGNTFTITGDTGTTVPTDHYTFTPTSPGNDFSVTNIEKFLTDHLTITCVSGQTGGIPPTPETGTLEINLRGGW